MSVTMGEVSKYLSYCPNTGVFTWKPRDISLFSSTRGWRTWNTRYAKQPAGYKTGKGYLHTKLLGKTLLLHRVAWLMVHDYYPDQIDHIDGDKLNNAICNLREVSNAENQRNKSINRNNTSGVTGVTAKGNKWVASIGGKYLGTFADKEEAVAVRKRAEKTMGYHANHGRSK